MNYLESIGKNAKKAFEDLKGVKHRKIKKVLENYNSSLLKNTNKIIRENLKDVKNVKRKHLVDRLILNKKRIEGIRYSINEIAKFKDPVGRILETWRRPNHLTIKKVSTPIGVIGVIYESRPNVTADVAALCLKSGNCSILRGGSEAFNSNKLLVSLFIFLSALTSQPEFKRAFIISLACEFKAFSSIRRVSTAPQILVLLIFALTIKFFAIFIFALLST